MIEIEPTGRTRYRLGWFGKIILQVEMRCAAGSLFDMGPEYIAWRDADVTDLKHVIENRKKA